MTDALASFLAFGVVVSFVAAFLFFAAFQSGWAEMARRFPDRSPMPRARASTLLRFGYGFAFGDRHIVVGVDEAGLHLHHNVVARLSHRPLLFPWPTVDARPAMRFGYSIWDVYGVGYFTEIAIPQRSRAAALVRDYLNTHAEAEHR
jgi:hypothetical protein